MLAESVHERPWPRDDWDHADLSDAVDVDRLDRHIDRCVHDADEFGMTLALVVVHGGRIVRERYGPETDAGTTLISWSMAKSITHALVGLLVEDGRLELSAPAPIGAWSYDERAEITLQQLLEMSSGLEFVEDYVDAGVSHVIEMLFGSGIDDHAAYAVGIPAGRTARHGLELLERHHQHRRARSPATPSAAAAPARRSTSTTACSVRSA